MAQKRRTARAKTLRAAGGDRADASGTAGGSRRRDEKPRRNHAWLLPTLVAVAALVVIAAIVYTVSTGQRFF